MTAESLLGGCIIASVINVLLLVPLLAVYIGNYRVMRSPMLLGLMIFILFLMLHNLAFVYSLATMSSLIPSTVTPHLLAFSLLETGGIAAFLAITFGLNKFV